MTNVQTTGFTAGIPAGGSQPRTALNKTFCDRNLLEMARTRFVHAEYGQKRTVPKGQGRKAEFRRWTPFEVNVKRQTLEEGVTPEGQDLSQSRVEAECRQYGAYVLVSDMLRDTAYDDVALGCTDLLGEQLGTVIERVTRDAMCAGDNVLFAGGNTSRLALTASDVLTTAEIRKAVRELKKAKARPFGGSGRRGHYICICSPDATYDLQSDPLWQDVSKYSNAEQIYSGEIGRIFGVVFVESPEAKVFSQSVLNAVKTTTSASAAFVLKADPGEAEKEYLMTPGAKLVIGGTEYTLAASDPFDPDTNTVTLSAAASLTADDPVYTEDAGEPDAATGAAPDVHAALVFGADAYGTVDIGGSGGIVSIIKGPGEGGDDPLDQRATFGAKVGAYAALILNDDWLIRIEHGVSA